MEERNYQNDNQNDYRGLYKRVYIPEVWASGIFSKIQVLVLEGISQQIKFLFFQINSIAIIYYYHCLALRIIIIMKILGTD